MRRELDVVHPLTHQQRQILGQTEAARVRDLTTDLRFRVTGPLDVPALAQAVEALADRHESLRTVFRVVNGDVWQRVELSTESPLTVVAGSSDSPMDAQSFRVTVTRRAEHDHDVVLTVQSLVTDGWSLEVLLRELSVSYAAAVRGQPPALPELEIQFLDWAAWHGSDLSEQPAMHLASWWRAALAPVGPGLPIATPPAGRSHRVRLPVGAEGSAMARELMRRERSGGFSVFAAALAIMLRRLGSTDVLALMTAVDNRDLVRVRHTVGRFEELVPMVVDLSGEPTFRELVARVRAGAAAMHSHRELSGDWLAGLVRELAHPATHALVGYSYRTRRGPRRLELLGCLVEHELSSGPCAVPLMVGIEDAGDAYAFVVDFDVAVFASSVVEGLVDGCVELLRDVAPDPTIRLRGAELRPMDEPAPAPIARFEPDTANRYGLPADVVAEAREFRRFLRDNVSTAPASESQIRRLSGAAGFLAPRFAVADGGRGLGILATVVVVEQAAATGSELARWAVGPPGPSVPSPELARMSPLLRRDYLTGLVRGDTTMCVAITERSGGSDLSSLLTRAVRTGSGWSIRGEKTHITNADDAAVALVLARTGDSGAVHTDLTAFLVPRSGYDIVASHSMLGDAATTYTVRFNAVDVTQNHVVSSVGNGLGVALSILDENRIYIAAQALGIAQWCFDQASTYVRRRTAYGATLGDLQGVSFALVDCAAALESTRALAYETARRADRTGTVSGLDCSMLKLVATERAYAIADQCVQVMGAHGLERETGVEGALRYLRLLRVVEGSTDVQRSVVARLLDLTSPATAVGKGSAGQR